MRETEIIPVSMSSVCHKECTIHIYIVLILYSVEQNIDACNVKWHVFIGTVDLDFYRDTIGILF